MPLFTAKVDYGLRALLDLAAQPPGRAAQGREIAARQQIPESYLNQLLVVLRRAGLVRSVRGAAGGYLLARDPHQVTAADVVAALHGAGYLSSDGAGGAAGGAAWVVRGLRGRVNQAVRRELERLTLADLVAEVHRLDEAHSLMLGL